MMTAGLGICRVSKILDVKIDEFLGGTMYKYKRLHALTNDYKRK